MTITTTKVNIEISLSQNYDKVTIGVVDEPLTYSTLEEFEKKVKEIRSRLREQVVDEFREIARARKGE